MRTRPTSGERMNHSPPPMSRMPASAMASVVEICTATNVVMTGPATQMISWAEASREKSGVSCRELTIFG
jgi:hypothetical protein